MANAEWYEVPALSADPELPNIESATTAAGQAASGTDQAVEIYRCTRTLVRTVQRNVTVTVTDVP